MRQSLGAAIAVALVLAGCGSGGTKTVTVTSTSSSSSNTSFSFSTATGSGSASTSETATTPPTTTGVTTSTSATASFYVHLATFKSPSGNIGCMIIAGTARCDIRQRKWSPPRRPASCPNIVDFGQGLIVGRSGVARFVCAGDTVMDPSAKALAYNTATVVGSFRCSSAANGITCTNTATSHGFFIAIQGYRVF